MDIESKVDKETIVIMLPEELDHNIATSVRSVADEAIYSGKVRNVEFDFTKKKFMDSSGLGMIMGRYKLIHPLGGKIYVSGVGCHVARIIKLSGVYKLVTEK